MKDEVFPTRGKYLLLLSVILCMVAIVSPISALHISTVDEGLLSDPHCYVGAYLGGEAGTKGPNNYQATSGQVPYESQILNGNVEFGTQTPDTGIDTFRSMAGGNNFLFSRYINLMYADTGSTYEKKPYVDGPVMWDWADAVIKKGGVPVLVLAPYSYTKDGKTGEVLDLNAECYVYNDKGDGITGKERLKNLANKLSEVSNNNNGATILIVFGPEPETADSVNPLATEHDTDGPHHQAYRQMFRDAADVIHGTGNKNLQIVWTTVGSDSAEVKKIYWPEFDNNMNDMGQKYVDWVGQNRYHATKGWDELAKMKPFYDFYAAQKNRPFIFVETAGYGSSDLSSDWIPLLYNPGVLQSTYPNIKGIIWFNVKKVDYDGALKQEVLRNFLLPNGDWVDHGTDTRGEVSGTNSQYSNAINVPYFRDFGGVGSSSGKILYPDIRIPKVSASRSASAPGQLAISTTVTNGGSGGAQSVLLFYYLKPGTGSKIRIGQSVIPDLPAGARNQVSVRLTIPSTVKPGTYTVSVSADPNNVIPESNENNNAGTDAVRIRIR